MRGILALDGYALLDPYLVMSKKGVCYATAQSAIHNAVEVLEAEGYKTSYVRGKGYLIKKADAAAPGTKRPHCEKCSKSFKTAEDLAEHKRLNHQEAAKQ